MEAEGPGPTGWGCEENKKMVQPKSSRPAKSRGVKVSRSPLLKTGSMVQCLPLSVVPSAQCWAAEPAASVGTGPPCSSSAFTPINVLPKTLLVQELDVPNPST